MSHELSVTVGIDGKFHNVTTSQGAGKKPLGMRAAVRRAIKNKRLGKGYLTEAEAISAAEARSRGFNKQNQK